MNGESNTKFQSASTTASFILFYSLFHCSIIIVVESSVNVALKSSIGAQLACDTMTVNAIANYSDLLYHEVTLSRSISVCCVLPPIYSGLSFNLSPLF